MSDTIRAFIAVKVPELTSLLALSSRLAALGRPVVAVAPANLHLTLKFLGQTPVEACAEIERRLCAAVHDQAPIRLRLEGVGAFPRPERPAVIWVGSTGGELLARIAQRLESELDPLGFAREPRPFQAHLTLARVKGRPSPKLFDLLREHVGVQFGEFEIGSVELMRSELSSEGSRYSIVCSCALRGAER